MRWIICVSINLFRSNEYDEPLAERVFTFNSATITGLSDTVDLYVGMAYLAHRRATVLSPQILAVAVPRSRLEPLLPVT